LDGPTTRNFAGVFGLRSKNRKVAWSISKKMRRDVPPWGWSRRHQDANKIFDAAVELPDDPNPFTVTVMLRSNFLILPALADSAITIANLKLAIRSGRARGVLLLASISLKGFGDTSTATISSWGSVLPPFFGLSRQPYRSIHNDA
jgi:hypothetical protein